MNNFIIVIPAYNPDIRMVEVVKNLVDKFKFIIVVNDGSKVNSLKYFNEIKMPAEKRYSVPLVAVDNNVLWIDGIGAAYDVEFSKNSKRGIKISVSRH